MREAMPYYKLWVEIEKTYTSGDGYLDKLCMELIGLDSSRCRPPTRDMRKLYRERTRKMLIETGVPRVRRQMKAAGHDEKRNQARQKLAEDANRDEPENDEIDRE